MSDLLKPIVGVQVVDRSLLKPNDYNPNVVSEDNLKLLTQSILVNGWTLPIVVRPDFTIIDGFHRWTVSGREPLFSMLGGKVPVVIVDHKDQSEDVYGTITHNRARGTHQLEPMKAIVKRLIDSGKTIKEIGKQLGMKPEEVFRLSDFTRDDFLRIMIKNNTQYSKAYDIQDLVYLSIDYKRQVVEADEFECGMRKLLNLGHTFAHAIEKLSDFSISHGHAVAMGINMILQTSLNHGYIDKALYENLTKIVNLNTGENKCPYSIKELCSAMQSDKKRSGDKITIITINGIGDCRQKEMLLSDLEGFFDERKKICFGLLRERNGGFAYSKNLFSQKGAGKAYPQLSSLLAYRQARTLLSFGFLVYPFYCC